MLGTTPPHLARTIAARMYVWIAYCQPPLLHLDVELYQYVCHYSETIYSVNPSNIDLNLDTMTLKRLEATQKLPFSHVKTGYREAAG